jgi:hypothetical protein
MYHVRIKCVTQSIANVINGHNRDEDHQAGKECHPWGFENVHLSGG